jgi:hypothetical protein
MKTLKIYKTRKCQRSKSLKRTRDCNLSIKIQPSPLSKLVIVTCANHVAKLGTNAIGTIKQLLARRNFALTAWSWSTNKTLFNIYKRVIVGDARIIRKSVGAKIVVSLEKNCIRF